MQRSIHVAAHAGTASDGQHLFQIAEDRTQKIDPKTGQVLATIPAPGAAWFQGLSPTVAISSSAEEERVGRCEASGGPREAD